ncbi:MAG: sigma-70 family RNA polymerase sigma factor [bacterium]|nr:sigma-70 family RNA polymerase sigma factor [bacterium]
MPHPAGEHELTRVLRAAEDGDSQAAEKLLPLVYDELRRVAQSQLNRHEPGQTLQATALVHEAWLRVVDVDDPGWDSRAHFFGAAARAMRNILVNRARRRVVRRDDVADRAAESDLMIESPVDDILAVHEALEVLEQHHPTMAQIVNLRFFAGLSMPDIARLLQQPLRSVERLWARARAWLEREVSGSSVREDADRPR